MKRVLKVINPNNLSLFCILLGLPYESTDAFPSDSVTRMKQAKITSSLFILLIVSILIRGAVLFSNPNTFNDDPDAYYSLATNWEEYRVFGSGRLPTAFRPPLYPALLKLLTPLQTREESFKNSDQDREKENTKSRSPSGIDGFKSFFYKNLALSPTASIILLHWILGVATVFLTWKYARNCGLPDAYAFWSALLVVCDPILLQQSRLIMTETLAAFFTALLLCATSFVVKKRVGFLSFVAYGTLGVFFGLSALCRPTFYLFVAFALTNLALIELLPSKSPETNPQVSNGPVVPPASEGMAHTLRRTGIKLLRLVCFVLGLALAVVPWGYRNYKIFGSPIVTTTHGGYTLYLANNPELYSHYETESALSLWDPTCFHTKRLQAYEEAVATANIKLSSPDEELFQNVWNKEQALNTINANPHVFAYSTWIRICELWRVLPHDVRNIPTKKSLSSLDVQTSGAMTNRVDRLARYAVASFYCVEFLILLIGIFQVVMSHRLLKTNRSLKELLLSPYIWGIWLILSIQIPHLFYWTNMRMRAPIQVALPVILLGLIYRITTKTESTSMKIPYDEQKR